jgi:glycine hydroxymethyltransferase
VLCKNEQAQGVDKTVFPGLQGGPLMHVIAGKAVCFGEALLPEFKEYARSIIANAKALAETLTGGGLKLVSGGTDNHLMLVDVTPLSIGGKLATQVLEQCGITVNMNMIPFDTRKPMDPSGVRLGTPALTTRGMGLDEMRQIGRWMLEVLKSPTDSALSRRIRGEVSSLCSQFPVPAAVLAPVESH